MFRSLSVWLDEVAAVDPGGLKDDELSAAIVELERLERRLAAERTRLVGAWDARRIWALDGFRSGAAWLAHRTKTPAAAARAVTAWARSLRAMPAVAAAFAAGHVNEHHVRLLSRLRRPRTAEAFAEAEAMLVGWARDMSMPDFARTAAYWLQCADPDGVEDDAIAGHAARRAYLSQVLDGVRMLDARFDTWAERSSPSPSRASRPSCSRRTGPRPGPSGVAAWRWASWSARRPSAVSTPWWRWPGGPGRCRRAPSRRRRCSPCWWAGRRSRDGSASWPTARW